MHQNTFSTNTNFDTQRIIVAAIQFDPKILDIKNNIKTALQLSMEAATKGAKLIVLPELCTSGYSLRSKREASRASQTRNGAQTDEFAKVAKKHNCNIVFGYVELLDGDLYNSAVMVGPNGFIANFQKHNLWGPSTLWATPSSIVPEVIITPAGRTGVLICRDIKNNYRESYQWYNPEYRFYRKGSVDTIALLTNWGESYGYPDIKWIELSESTNANIIVSNRVGKCRDLEFKGGSTIIDKNLDVWSYGSSFTKPAIVGGAITI